MKLNKSPHRGDSFDEEGVNWTGEEIAEFLRDLDEDDELEVSDWEAKFIQDNLGRKVFSPKQRIVIRKLHEKYGH